MPLDFDTTSNIGIIISARLVFLIKPLPQCSFQKTREQIDKEIENALLVGIMLQVKKVDGEHFLQHKMQEIIAFVVSKSRTDTDLCAVIPDKTHNVTCHQSVFTVNGKDMLRSNLVAVLVKGLRKNEQSSPVLGAQFAY